MSKTPTYLRRMREANDAARAAAFEKRRLSLVEEYAGFHDREWLEAMSYSEIVARYRSGQLDRPTLPS